MRIKFISLFFLIPSQNKISAVPLSTFEYTKFNRLLDKEEAISSYDLCHFVSYSLITVHAKPTDHQAKTSFQKFATEQEREKTATSAQLLNSVWVNSLRGEIKTDSKKKEWNVEQCTHVNVGDDGYSSTLEIHNTCWNKFLKKNRIKFWYQHQVLFF